ncbi:MAG: L-threonylcarbamoyladenylate synthase [Bradymonadia bacterium]
MSASTPSPSSEEIALAVAALEAGELVAMPTETVYGLAADATSPEAVGRIFDAKGRPRKHPVIVHLGDASWMARWAAEITPEAEALAEAFWPGPMTLIVPRGPAAHDGVTGGRPTVGLRVPGHPVALALVQAFGRGVAAPSANRFGRVSPTEAAHVAAELGDRVSVILDGGPCDVGVESTIVDLTGPKARVLRPGHVTPEALGAVLGYVPDAGPVVVEGNAGEAPGTLASHYAPRAGVYLLPRGALAQAALEDYIGAGEAVAVYARCGRPSDLPEAIIWRRAPDSPRQYAQQLYATLRALDEAGVDSILVETPPEHPQWQAIADRLSRAAAPRMHSQASPPGEQETS